MTRPLNECIAVRAFAALILDYEWPGDEWTPPYASGRILIEDRCYEHVAARSREELIDYFQNWRG